MTSINDINDLVRIIRDDPGWAEVIRGVLLGQELLELPERFAEFVQLTNDNFRLVHQRLEQLEADVAGLKTDVAGLKTGMTGLKTGMTGLGAEMENGFRAVNGRLDNMMGLTYEYKVEKNIRTIANQRLGVRQARTRKGPFAGFPSELTDAFDQAEKDGVITPAQNDELDSSDLILHGTDVETGERVNIAVEVSVTIGDEDIERAARRAGILERASGESAVAAVIGAHIDAARTILAEEKGVRTALVPE